MRFVTECDDYTKELRHNAGASVFRAHPGIRSTMITDMAGLDFVFSAAPEVLDRLDDAEPGFGGLAFNRELLGGITPALMAHGEGHGPARQLVIEAIKLRRAQFGPACEKVHHYGIPMLREPARGVEVDFQNAIHHAAVSISFEWLFGLAPGPDGAELRSWLKGCFGMKSDQPLANALVRSATRMTNGPTAAHRAFSAKHLDAIRRSAPYASYLDVAKRVGVPEADVAAHLMFAAAFNATGGTFTTLYPAMAQLSVDLVNRERLQHELRGFAGTLWELNKLPFLEDFFLESMRLFGRPRHYYRRAKVDLEIPTSEGAFVPVRAGTTLCLVATVARQDRAVWGDDASVFDPERYGRSPELRRRVLPFGPPSPGGNEYGCPGASEGMASILWKSLAAALGRSVDWRLEPWPEPDVDAFEGVRPAELKWVRL